MNHATTPWSGRSWRGLALPRRRGTAAAALALLGMLSVALAQMSGGSRGIGTSVTNPPSVRYGSGGMSQNTRLMPSEARNVQMSSGMMPSEMRDVRMNSGMPQSGGRAPSPYGGASARYSSYNRAYANTANGASTPASVRYQNPAVASAGPMGSPSRTSIGSTRSPSPSPSRSPSTMGSPSMRYGSSASMSRSGSYGSSYGRR